MTDETDQMGTLPDPELTGIRLDSQASRINGLHPVVTLNGRAAAPSNANGAADEGVSGDRWRAIVHGLVFETAHTRLQREHSGVEPRALGDSETVIRFAEALYGMANDPMIGDPARWLSRQAASMHDKLAFLEAVARKLGDHWCDDSYSFVDVTIAMGRLQLIIRQIMQTHNVGPTKTDRGTAMVIVPPGEQHTFGQCIVEELFRADGWATELMCPSDVTGLIERIKNIRPQVLCLSWSTGALSDSAARTIRAIDDMPFETRPAIIAGGRASRDHAGWIVRLGVQCLCENTFDALSIAHDLLQRRTQTEARGALLAPSAM